MAKGSATGQSMSRFSTAAKTTTRTHITTQASRMPLARAYETPRPDSSRLRFANDSVTAVDDTRPPVKPVSAAPRSVPSQRVAT